MTPFICFALVAFLSRPTWAAAATATSSMVGNEQYRVHQSHVFHVEPRALIDSVKSDVRRQTIAQNGKELPLLDIDVSSTRLDDRGAVSLMEELLPLVKSKVVEAEESRRPILIKLALAMNKITPSGASSLFDVLTNNVDDKDESTNGDIPVENGKSGDEDNKTSETENEADSVIGTGDALEVLDCDGGESNNETNSDEATNSASLEEQTSIDTYGDVTKPVLEEPEILIEELDLSFNDIGGHGINPPNVKLLESVRKLFQCGGSAFVPRVLSFENCGIGPAFCRSIGRGILNAFERKSNGAHIASSRPSVLRMGGNNAIGDAGTVALAASLRMAMGNDSDSHHVVLEELDLSHCNVGDAGAEALALALGFNPGCLCRLNLSNNKITDAGAKSLGRALVDASRSGVVFEQIILDNNDIGDDGAAALADALACGSVKSISVRSCAIQAQGTAAFGKALMLLANGKNCDGSTHYHIDLSGNHFGTRMIKKKKGIRDKASTNIKFIGKTLKGAAKRFGSETMGLTAESDDDEEIMGGLIDDEEEINSDKIQACGGHAFAGEILGNDQHLQSQKKERALISVGMRQCRLDAGAIDALSASIVGATSCHLSVDVSMNEVEDTSIADALIDAKNNPKLLSTMAHRHVDFLARLADARQRQLEAVEEIGGTFFDNEDDAYGAG
ncbi:hypothetical protein ACHAXR_012797 [Thalassiosira sp. AJA248-18]